MEAARIVVAVVEDILEESKPRVEEDILVEDTRKDIIEAGHTQGSSFEVGA